MPAFVLKGLTVRVANGPSHENPSREPLVILTLKDDESERDVKIPWKAWVQIAQHVSKVARDEMSGMLSIPLMERVPGPKGKP